MKIATTTARTAHEIKKLLNFFNTTMPITNSYAILNLITLQCQPEELELLCLFLNKHSLFQFKTLISITGIDYVTRSSRFDLLYDFYSPQYNSRIRVQVTLNYLQSSYSLHKLYGSAPWLEREVWDLYGIFFLNHPNLARLLTDYGFDGYPLRKDFPLSGYLEIAYLYTKQTCTYIPLELTQTPKKIGTPLFSFQEN